jgi:uncharacterized RDD family membrane protein YckC
MSQVAQEAVGPNVMDPFDIGWYIESADEETYGPVSRKTVRGFLQDQTITPNTLVRHCTQPEARPAADQNRIMEGLTLEGRASALGDRLADAWPRKKRDQAALAEDTLPCAWHKRPAKLVCVRCHAPYCDKCRARPFKKQYYLCRRCQTGMYNRRFLGWLVDVAVLVYVPYFATLFILIALGTGPTETVMVLNIVYLVTVGLFFFVRDSLFGGAGIGKRATGLRVVQSQDGTTPLTYGQGFVRWLSQFIPLFNLFDAMVPFRDPLIRRFGDRWAGTRVIDTERKLAKDRQKIARRLIKKGIQPAQQFGMTMEGLARLA